MQTAVHPLEKLSATLTVSLVIISAIAVVQTVSYLTPEEPEEVLDAEINGVGLIILQQPVNTEHSGKPYMIITVVNDRSTEFSPCGNVSINATLSTGENVSGYIKMEATPVEPGSRQSYILWFNATKEADIVSVRWTDGSQYVDFPTVTRFA